MPKSLLSPVAVALVAAGWMFQIGPSSAQIVYAPRITLSPSLVSIFKEAQKAERAKQWLDVIAKAQEALAGSRKPDDTYYANYLLAEAYRATGDRIGERKALQGMVDSELVTPSQRTVLLKKLSVMKSQGQRP